MEGFEPPTFCSQSRRASQITPHPDNIIIIKKNHLPNNMGKFHKVFDINWIILIKVDNITSFKQDVFISELDNY